MEIVDSETEEKLWAPNDFGSYSIEKVRLLTTILQNLLKDVTIKMDGTFISRGESYSKEEVDNLLKDYILRADYGDIAGPAIRATTNEYLLTLKANGDIVDTEVTNRLVYAADFWTRCCFNMTYLELVNASVAPSAVSFSLRFDNLESIQNSHTTYLSKITADMYLNPSTRTGLKLSSKSFTGESDTAVIGSGNATYSSLLEAVNSILSTSVVGNFTSYGRRISNLESSVSSLSSRVYTLESKVSSLESSVSSHTGSIKSLSDRVTALENKS